MKNDNTVSTITLRYGVIVDGVWVNADRLKICIIYKDKHLVLIFIITTDAVVYIYVVFRFLFLSVVSISKPDP
jgi:hypothetical protein